MGTGDPGVQSLQQWFDSLPPKIVRHSECRAYLRRALAAEIGLVGRFESGVVRQWNLTVDAETSHLRDAISRSGGTVGRSNVPFDTELRKSHEAVYATDADMTQFAAFLSRHFGEPVFDRTGLTDRYSFTFVWQPVPDGADKREREIEAMRAAMRPWWGLVLEPTQGEMRRLVVERVEPPPVHEHRRR
jgi:uncharacterized protein (TIGR03435 family)